MHFLNKLIKNQDIVVSLLIGLATILTAYATFVGGLWGSNSTALYSKSIVELSEANTSYLEFVQGGLEEGELEQIFKKYQEGWDQSKSLLDQADKANNNNDKYLLMSVLLAISIFLGSMSLVIKSSAVKINFMVISGIIFLTALIWTLTLPRPF